MRTNTIRFGLVVLVCCVAGGEAHARGFGGFRAGGFSASSFSGFRGASYSGASSFSSARLGGFSGASSSYDRSFTDARGGSYSASGTRAAASGPFGGVAAGGSRDVSATTAGGRTYSSSASRAGVVGPAGNFAAGGSRYSTASGLGGTVSGGTRFDAAGTRFTTDAGLSHYSTVGGYGTVAHSTAFWSNDYLGNRAGLVRGSFAAYNSFNPTWYTLHPGAWLAAGWAANTAWTAATWPSVATFVNITAPPVYLDYGNSIVYQGNDVYVNGTDAGTAEQYNQQALNLATAGQEAKPPKTDPWQTLGVFALAQGDEQSSNTMFQLAVNKAGIIRGNYYDALMGTTTEVYGSVDPKTQRTTWTIGDKKSTVFETGIYNLTKDQTPVLVHFGKDKTQQWLLVRVQKPQQQGQ